MHKTKEYMTKIYAKNDVTEMKKIEEFFHMMLHIIHEHDPEKACWIKTEIRELACGKVLTEEEAEEWVCDMKPCGRHWTKEETTAAMQSLGYKCDAKDYFISANMQFNDYNDLVKEKEELALHMAYRWLNDDDAVDNKTYEFYKHMVKH